jgi:signal transduction histidine kinase
MLLQSSPPINQTTSELELLYQVSRGIIYSSNPTEVASAISQVFSDTLVVVIYAWQNFNRDGATYLEILGSSTQDLPVGARHPSSVIPQVFNGVPNQPVIVDDIDDSSQVDPITAAEARRFGYHSYMVVNLQYSNRVLGAFSLGCKTKYNFSALEKRLISGITDLASSAFEYFRLHDKNKAQMRELQAVAQISAAAATLHDEALLLNAIESLLQLYMQPDRVCIYLLHNTHLIEHSLRVSSSAPLDRITLDDTDSILIQAARERTIVEVACEIEPTDPAAIQHTCEVKMAVPMIVNRSVIGVLHVCRSNEHRFSTADLRLMTTLADLVAVALQNTRFLQQAQEIAALEERNRLARELHDSVSQALYGIALGTQTARKMLDKDSRRLGETLDYILTLAEAGMTEMRALIFELRPESLETEGIVVALAKLGASIQARHGIDVRLELDTEPALSVPAKESLYRVVREALHNVVKHANAKQIILRTKCGHDSVNVAIIDDGIGFESGQDFPGHLGLHSMQERVMQLGGSFEIDSVPNEGTIVKLTLPYQNAELSISI